MIPRMTATTPDTGRPAGLADASADELAVTTIRTLAMDAVQAANSGHPGHADGAGARGLHAVAALPALRSRRPDLAEPRPLRALDRPRLDAAVRAAAPRGRQGGEPGLRGARRAVGAARGHQALPPARLASAPGHPSTAGPRASRRPPARSGRASPPRVGMAIAGAVAGRALQPARASSCSTTTSTPSAATAT